AVGFGEMIASSGSSSNRLTTSKGSRAMKVSVRTRMSVSAQMSVAQRLKHIRQKLSLRFATNYSEPFVSPRLLDGKPRIGFAVAFGTEPAEFFQDLFAKPKVRASGMATTVPGYSGLIFKVLSVNGRQNSTHKKVEPASVIEDRDTIFLRRCRPDRLGS